MGRFVVDPAASVLSVNARSNLHPIGYRASLRGHIDVELASGAFELDPPVLGRLEVSLRDLHAGDPLHDAELRRRLDIGRYPTATATIDEVAASGTDHYRLGVSLDLLGATRRLGGNAVVTLDGERLNAAGSISLDIRDFGIKPPRLLLLRVEPQVEIQIRLVAVLSPG